MTDSTTECPSRRRRLCQSPDPAGGSPTHAIPSSSALSRTGTFGQNHVACQPDAPHVPAGSRRCCRAAGEVGAGGRTGGLPAWEAVRHHARQCLTAPAFGGAGYPTTGRLHTVHTCSTHTHTHVHVRHVMRCMGCNVQNQEPKLMELCVLLLQLFCRLKLFSIK